MKRPSKLLVALWSAVVAGGGFAAGRLTAAPAPLGGSLSRAMTLTPQACVTIPAARERNLPAMPGVPLLVEWKSAWPPSDNPDPEFVNAAIGLSIADGEAWSAREFRVNGSEPNGVSEPARHTPSGKASRSWLASRNAPRDPPSPTTTKAEVYENSYANAASGRWEFLLAQRLPRPTEVTVAFFDIDGSIIERSLTVDCTSSSAG